MTTPPPPPDAMAAARGLTDALNGMAERLDAVRKDSEERDKALAEYGQTNRRLIRGLIVSLVIDLIVTVAVGLIGIQAHNNATALKKTAASNLALCEAGNVARHQQIQLWDFVLSIGHRPDTAQERRVIAEFKQHLAEIYAPRHCMTLGQKN